MGSGQLQVGLRRGVPWRFEFLRDALYGSAEDDLSGEVQRTREELRLIAIIHCVIRWP